MFFSQNSHSAPKEFSIPFLAQEKYKEVGMDTGEFAIFIATRAIEIKEPGERITIPRVAMQLGKSIRQIHRRAQSLVRKGLLNRGERGENGFDFSPFLQRVEERETSE